MTFPPIFSRPSRARLLALTKLFVRQFVDRPRGAALFRGAALSAHHLVYSFC
jgi:hypothetical protein